MSWYAELEYPWHVHAEHRLSFAYHWSLEEIDRSPAAECLVHLILIKRREASEHEWMWVAAVFDKLTESARKQITRSLASEMEAGRRRLTEFEVADDKSRIVMIGTAIRLHGERWKQSHQSELAWLAHQKVTHEEAVQRSMTWEEDQLADEFWDHSGK